MASHCTSARPVRSQSMGCILLSAFKTSNLNVNRPNVLQLLKAIIENFKKKNAQPHGILGYSKKRIERLTFCIHLFLRRAFRYLYTNSFFTSEKVAFCCKCFTSAQVYGILVATRIYNGNRTESAWSAKKAEIIRVMSKWTSAQRELDLIITSITRPKLRDTKFNYHFITLIWNRRTEIPNTRFYWFSSLFISFCMHGAIWKWYNLEPKWCDLDHWHDAIWSSVIPEYITLLRANRISRITSAFQQTDVISTWIRAVDGQSDKRIFYSYD